MAIKTISMTLAALAAAAFGQTTFLIDADHGRTRATVAKVGGTLRIHPDVHRYEVVTLTDAQRSAFLDRVPEAKLLPASDDILTGQHVVECAWTSPVSTSNKKTKAAVSIDINEGWNGPDHGPASLTYSYGRMYSTMSWPEATNRAQVVTALNKWAEYALLTFTETTNRTAARNLDFSFPENSPLYGHLDANGYVCDPPGTFSGSAHSVGGAGHANGIYYPQLEPTSGDVHISDMVPFVYYDQSVLLRLLTHEGGHSLGLPHNDSDTTAVMYGLVGSGGATLNATDIAWIQSVYAPRPGSPPPPPPPASTPVISSFTATPSISTPGAPVALSWDITGAASATINQASVSALGGTTSVYPQVTTTYTLTATNSSGSVSSTVTVTILGAAPTINSFSVSPSSITANFSSLASWAVTGATTVTITPNVGTVGLLGSLYLYPQQTTTYTLTATNASGSSTSTATVTVSEPPCQGRNCGGGGGSGTLALAVTSSTDYSCCGSVETGNPLTGTISGGTPPYVALSWAHGTMYGYSGACSIAGDTFSCSGIPLNSGSNSVTLTVTDSAGGSASTTVTITGRSSR